MRWGRRSIRSRKTATHPRTEQWSTSSEVRGHIMFTIRFVCFCYAEKYMLIHSSGSRIPNHLHGSMWFNVLMTGSSHMDVWIHMVTNGTVQLYLSMKTVGNTRKWSSIFPSSLFGSHRTPTRFRAAVPSYKFRSPPDYEVNDAFLLFAT